jgi:hypothetical protein
MQCPGMRLSVLATSFALYILTAFCTPEDLVVGRAREREEIQLDTGRRE